MTTETMKQEIQELVEQGWEADAAPRAVEKHYQFPTFASTVKFLVGLGKAAESAAPFSQYNKRPSRILLLISGRQ